MKKEQLQGVQDRKKGKIDLNKGLGINKDEVSRACAGDKVIDTDKRKHFGDEPKFTT